MNVVTGPAKAERLRAYTESQAALAADYLERARAIAPMVAREAEAGERGSMITKAVHDAYVANSLYWMVVPKVFGGAELGGRGCFGVVEELSRADGSSGWSLMANAFNTGLTAGFIPDDGADQLFGGKDKAITCGQFSASGKAVEVDGGLMGGGHYSFGSGSGHTTWIGGGVTVYENGKPRILENGMPDTRVIHVPNGKYKLAGNWDVIGLVGTASFDYDIPEQFVPHRYIMEGSPVPKFVRGGPFYHVGWFGFGALGHSAIVLGITNGLHRACARAPGLQTSVRGS
jgi:alkylation response protein AidB-like acyl-CoA dehydrogenase